LLKAWDGVGQLVEEIDLKLLEEREGNVRKKYFQVSASALKSKTAEVRKCDERHDWCSHQLFLNVTTGIVGVEINAKCLQLRHE
jgi:hypothetical protein